MAADKEAKVDIDNEIILELSTFENVKEYYRQYEEKIVQLIRQFKKYDRLESFLHEIIEDNTCKEEIGYVAFFTLCTIYRRNRNFSRYDLLVNNLLYSRKFEKYISFNHLKSMCCIEMTKTKSDVLEAIELSKDVIEKTEALIKEEEKSQVNIGFYHSFAVNVAKGFEEGYLCISKDKDDEYLVLAKQYVEKSIKNDKKYAKFHCTLGRLYLIEKKYEEAIDEFRMAIDYEDSNNQDYALRVNDYQSYILSARTYVNMEKINSTIISEVKKEIEDIRAKNIEVLSFFVGIMSFVIGSIQLANSVDTFIDKAALIILLFGSLLITLGSFGRNLNGSIKRSYTFSITVGLLMIISSIVLHFHF